MNNRMSKMEVKAVIFPRHRLKFLKKKAFFSRTRGYIHNMKECQLHRPTETNGIGHGVGPTIIMTLVILSALAL